MTSMETSTALDATNRGFRLLQKMGWKQGTGLGRHEQGIVEPVKMKENLTCLGLGKAEEYDDMTEQATKERRKLDSEVVETLETQQLRLERAARDSDIVAAVTAANAGFLCRDCQKQYKTASEIERHLSSYDHHHRKRLDALRKAHTTVDATEQDAKRKREQQHADALMQKRVAAAAVATVTTTVPVASPAVPAFSASNVPAGKVGFAFGKKLAATKAKSARKPLGGVAAAFGELE